MLLGRYLNLVHQPCEMRCVNSFETKDGHKVPCGRCYNCCLNRVNGWAFRVDQHAKYNVYNGWFLLTYATCPRTPNNFRTLKTLDIQNFIKCLRRLEAKEYKPGETRMRVSYLMCGEYGTKNKRPHWHCFFFNLRNINNVQLAWHHGFTTCDPTLTHGNIFYTLKYQFKDHSISRVGRFSDDDRMREKMLVSKNFGERYLTPAVKRFYLKEQNLEHSCFIQVEDYKHPMPRYYRNKIYNDEQKERIYARQFARIASLGREAKNRTEQQLLKDFESTKTKNAFRRKGSARDIQ